MYNKIEQLIVHILMTSLVKILIRNFLHLYILELQNYFLLVGLFMGTLFNG